MLPSAPMIHGAETDEQYLLKEWSAALLGFLQALPCPVVNRPQPLRSFRQPLLAAWAGKISAAGFDLPDMLVTGSYEEAGDFRARHAGQCVAVTPSGHPCTTDDHGPAPMCLLATPSGLHRDVFVAGEEVFSSLTAGVPAPLADRCRRAARSLGLEFAQFQVFSGEAGDTVMAASDFPDTSACSSDVRRCLAIALAAMLAGAGREVAA